MKILTVITRGDTIGGAQTHVSLIAKRLQDDSHDVDVVFGGEVGPFAGLERAKQYDIHKMVDKQIELYNEVLK